MEEDEFNFHRTVKCEKNVAQLALQNLFETLWDRIYPETPWAQNAESIKLFEQKEDEHFHKSLEELPNSEKRKKNNKRNQLQNTFRDNNWKNYDWDISKFIYALVDSKLFDLDETDETGMPVSEHVVKIKDIRNEIAHFRTTYCNTEYFEKTFKSIEAHIKALELVKLNVSPYIEELHRIKSQEKPVSAREFWEIRTQFEHLKMSQQVYEEREKRYALLEKMNAESKKHTEEMQRLQYTSELQKHTHSTCSKELQKLQSENDSLKQTYSEELKHLRSENELLKQTHSEELKRLRSENALQKLMALKLIDVLQEQLQEPRLSEKHNISRFRHGIVIKSQPETQFQKQRHSA
ncbi:uncharacterized protein LOC128551025 [Mercenaria mercenaria]|uniref:uncharacterized protein LOC128551025 n=1 Tax=Mercenaria mercenaria TaxID=6596 RepID=UPI00234EC24C|nr:uncharacterized protein LOC128551025 [Mercenaria mercenaria]